MPGVMPYTNINGQIYVLLGNDKGQGWCHFSGGTDRKDHGSNKQAAAREAYEESCGLLGSIEDIKRKMFRLNSGDKSYLLKVGFNKHQRITNHKFKSTQKSPKFKSHVFQEKSDIRWVKLSNVIYGAKHGNGRVKVKNGEYIQLRDFFKKMMKTQEGIFEKKFPSLKGRVSTNTPNNRGTRGTRRAGRGRFNAGNRGARSTRGGGRGRGNTRTRGTRGTRGRPRSRHH